LAFRAIAYERNWQWSETATILPVIACLTWTFGSWPLLSRAWPAIAFLVFMLPLPPSINNSIALPLQQFAAIGSCFLLQLSGLWAVREGNVINLATPHGTAPLDVALACSGLRMLMTLAATVTATIILFPLPTWKRVTLLLSAVPIALVSNMIRIVATGWCNYLFEGEWAKHKAHDWSGYLMMLVGMALVWLELKILSWLVPDEEPDDDRKPISPLLTRQGISKDKLSNRDLVDI
jgi:exosortase